MDLVSLFGIALWALIPGFIAMSKGRSFWGYYLLSFLITPLITMIITICLRKVKLDDAPIQTSATTGNISNLAAKNESREAISAELSTVSEPIPFAPQTPRKILYCRRCGNKLIEGSEFCSNCGNEIEKEDTQ